MEMLLENSDFFAWVSSGRGYSLDNVPMLTSVVPRLPQYSVSALAIWGHGIVEVSPYNV